MKLSDLKNPRAANEAIKAFRRKFKAKVCLAPHASGCGGGVVSAHTLSLKAMLSPLARDGHVYAPVADVLNRAVTGPVGFRLLGLRDTSVFNGFCSVHDAGLFSPIENDSFACSYQQVFLHAFRAVAKESYLKRKQAEGPMTLKTVCEIHGYGPDSVVEFSSDMKLYLAASMRGAEEIERLKSKLDAIYLAQEWGRLVTTIIPFATMPSITASFVYSPDFDFAGNYLQEFENFETDLDQLIITVLPTVAGGGYALLSHLDTVGKAPRQLVSSLLETPDVSSALLWLILNQSENIALAPVWFEGLEAGLRDRLVKHFLVTADPFYTNLNRLKEFPAGIVNWSPGKAFAI